MAEEPCREYSPEQRGAADALVERLTSEQVFFLAVGEPFVMDGMTIDPMDFDHSSLHPIDDALVGRVASDVSLYGELEHLLEPGHNMWTDPDPVLKAKGRFLQQRLCMILAGASALKTGFGEGVFSRAISGMIDAYDRWKHLSERIMQEMQTVRQTMRLDPEPGERAAAVLKLCSWKDPRAVTDLIEALSDSHPGVRSCAANALAEIVDERAVPSLLVGLQDSDSEVRSSAACALGAIRDARALDALIAGLSDVSAGVRHSAAWALGKIAEPRALEHLSGLLSDGDAGVRKCALTAMANFQDSRVLHAAVGALRDDSPEVRAAAAPLLAAYPGPPAVEALIAALEDADVSVKGAAARSLGELKDTRAVDALIGCLGAGGEVEKACLGALTRLTGKSFLFGGSRKKWAEWWATNRKASPGGV
ncbi:MAG: HEAT repeat domain-containing protein [Bacteroidota bacterium]